MHKRDVFDYITAVEKTLFSIVVISFAMLSFVQVLLTKESWRNYLNFASRLESQQIVIAEDKTAAMSASGDMKAGGGLTLELQGYHSLPKAYVLVNGREVKNFASDSVTFNVRAGDIVEIDGTYYSKPFKVNVTKVTDNILIPQKDAAFSVQGEIVSLPELKFLH
jgi:hypothetical protein